MGMGVDDLEKECEVDNIIVFWIEERMFSTKRRSLEMSGGDE